MQDFCADKIISATVTQPSELAESLTLIFQAQLAIGLRLFEGQCRQAGVSSGIENLEMCPALSAIVNAMLHAVGDGAETRQMISSVISQQAGKSAKPIIRSMVQRMIRPDSAVQLVGESSADQQAVNEQRKNEESIAASLS